MKLLCLCTLCIIHLLYITIVTVYILLKEKLKSFLIFRNLDDLYLSLLYAVIFLIRKKLIWFWKVDW